MRGKKNLSYTVTRGKKKRRKGPQRTGFSKNESAEAQKKGLIRNRGSVKKTGRPSPPKDPYPNKQKELDHVNWGANPLSKKGKTTTMKEEKKKVMTGLDRHRGGRNRETELRSR